MAYAPPNKRINIYLKNADGESSVNKNYGSAAVSATGIFFYSASTVAYIHRMLIYIYDTKGMEVEEYGNLGAALSTGLSLTVWNSAGGSAELDMMDGRPVTTNGEWSGLCYDVDLKSWTNTSNEVVAGRWSFDKAGEPLYLTAKQQLRLTAVDDLSGLIDHRFMIQGLQQH